MIFHLFSPCQGDLRPDSAMSSLTIFEGKFNRLQEERDNVIKAKEALELADPGGLVGGTGFLVMCVHTATGIH